MKGFLPRAIGVYDKHQKLIRNSVRLSRPMAKEHFAALKGEPWGSLKKKGYHCRMILE